MRDDGAIPELDDDERRLFSQLPRDCAHVPAEEDRVVQALESAGFLRPRGVRRRWMLQTAAAIILLAIGGWAGARYAGRGSLEAMLARDDLSPLERVLLLQRAGSAYVQAAHAYAAATAKTDTTAVEVARQVLLGAAHAVARSHLDGGVSSRLTAVLQAPLAPGASHPAQPVIWF